MKEAIQRFLQVNNLELPASEESIKKAWREITGEMIYKLTDNLYVKDRVLYVTISIAALKQELYMHRSSLIEKINDYLGRKAVDQIVIR